MPDPTPTAAQLLELAGRHYRGAGAREQAMRDELDMSAVAFWRLVNAVINDPPVDVAVEFGPLILRLRRCRAVGVRRRVAGGVRRG